MQQLLPSQSFPEIPINENFETLAALAVFGKNQPLISGLTWGYYGGQWGNYSIADGTVTLTDNAVNYLVVEVATGTVSVSTATTHWNDSANYARAFKITTVSGSYTTALDYRSGPGGTMGSASGALSVAAVDVSVADAANHYTGTDAEAVFAEVGATLAILAAPVVTDATSNRNMANADKGAYLRMTDAVAKTLTVALNSTTALDADFAITVRCVNADLTLTPVSGVTLNAPNGGTLVVSDAMTVTLKRVAANVFDVIGQTVPV